MAATIRYVSFVNFKPILYSIVDIETTGLSPQREKITEIAIYIYDGEQVVDEFTSLINPEIEIPYRITQLTGINNKMVTEAPKFYEVARRIVEMTENTVLVGHNVNFDYNFLRKEFRELGYDYNRKKICTAKLSRKLLPGRRSYSLGKLCQELNIENPHRHRAYGDATATVLLFGMLMTVESNIQAISLRELNTSLDRNFLRKLPQETGVYYFYNEADELIYVGKSKNIHDRVMSHLTNNSSRRAIEMRNQIADIGYELTGNELIALLLESDEIKKHMPVYNRAQRRIAVQWGLFYSQDADGYLRLKIDRNDREDLPLVTFNSLQGAKSHVFTLTEAFHLCQKLCGLYETNNSCFQYKLKQCHGACIGEESPEEYNARVRQAIEPYRFDALNFFIIGPGRNETERSAVWVESGKYRGFGFYGNSLNDNLSAEVLSDFIQPYPDNRDVQQIIRSCIKRPNGYRVVRY